MFPLYHIKHKMLDCCVLSCSVVSDSLQPMDCSLPSSSVHRIPQAKIRASVTIFFSRGSSWPRDGIRIPCIAGRFFYCWAIREALFLYQLSHICLILRMTRGIQHTRSLKTSVIIPTETNMLELNKDALQSI